MIHELALTASCMILFGVVLPGIVYHIAGLME